MIDQSAYMSPRDPVRTPLMVLPLLAVCLAGGLRLSAALSSEPLQRLNHGARVASIPPLSAVLQVHHTTISSHLDEQLLDERATTANKSCTRTPKTKTSSLP
ncbi:uncharacterized protein TrAtP1_000308 [Trichoderma atroviride]|uniref:uncharacterized protein n=1 Tax=Hypocrea atroviridis TaxID=63577 RepID=UPI003325FBA7|nr:hypothetical protein TrAtP1_000308 [Trichoderma atroviride]